MRLEGETVDLSEGKEGELFDESRSNDKIVGGGCWRDKLVCAETDTASFVLLPIFVIFSLRVKIHWQLRMKKHA